MAYKLYLGDILYPVTPSKIDVKIKGQNKTLTLINDGQINVLKTPGLSEISFDLLLPNVIYPKSIAVYESGFQNAKYYLDELEKLKIEKKAVYLKITRELPSLTHLYDNEIKVSLEDYTIKEDAKQGFDVIVSVKLKQYRDYGTKLPDISFDSLKKTRPSEKTTETTKYTVVAGDSLWNIAKKFYGDGSKYMTIYNANKGIIGGNPNLIHPGQVLTIPDAKSNSFSSSSSPNDTKGSNTTPTQKTNITVHYTGVPQLFDLAHVSYTLDGKTNVKSIRDTATIRVDKGTSVKVYLNKPPEVMVMFNTYGDTITKWEVKNTEKSMGATAKINIAAIIDINWRREAAVFLEMLQGVEF